MAAAPTVKVEKKSPINIGDTVNRNYKLVNELGRGGFGVVYEVEDKRNRKKYAMKVELERPKKEEPGLNLEICVLKRLQGSKNVVRYIDSGTIADKHGFLIMQLIGRNLADLRRASIDGKFTLSTTIRACLQCLDAIEFMHNADLLHRDVKPGNFAIGKLENELRNIYILDFGMVRRYRLKTGALRKERPSLGFRGTVKYASPNVHQNIDTSRRDDLWSWLYMMIEFQKGELPWKGLVEKKDVGVMKMNPSSRDTMVSGLMPEIAQIYDSIAKIKWLEAPQYDWIRQRMISILRKNGLTDNLLDWEKGGTIYKQVKSALSLPLEKKASIEKVIKEKSLEKDTETI